MAYKVVMADKRRVTLSTQPACAGRLYHIGSDELPLSCPTQEMALWNAHPRVFLAIEKTGKAVCPYCSATFILDNDNDDENKKDQ